MTIDTGRDTFNGPRSILWVNENQLTDRFQQKAEGSVNFQAHH
jgi:hypothetical protein